MMYYVQRFIYYLTYPIRMFLDTPSRLMAGPRRLFGISMAARVAILVWLLLIICATLSVLAFLWMTPERSPVDVKLNFNFFLVVSILIVVIPLVVYQAVRLWMKGDVSRFPDIDRAWKAGVGELSANGLDLTDIPLFLILGSADEKQEKALFGAAKLDLGMEGTPEGPAALHWYANNDGVYLVVSEACCLGKKYNVASVCIRPTDVRLAKKELGDSDVPVSVVVGFPHGHNRPEVKALEAKLAIEDGAEEIDMVMNIGKFLSGDYEHVKKDIEAVVAEAKKQDVIVKVIFESCYLSAEQVAKACLISRDAGADYVKTSTGFGDGPATPEVIDVMMKTVGDSMGVKASGGVRSWDTAIAYLNQGCKRLGVGSTEAVLEGAK